MTGVLKSGGKIVLPVYFFDCTRLADEQSSQLIFAEKAPELRIVTDAQWQLAQEQRSVKRKTFGRTGNGQLQGRQPGAESKYLLAGLARCSVCNGTIHVRSRSHGRKRAYHSGCSAYHERGTKVCANGAIVALTDTNTAVITQLENAVINGAVVARVVALVRERLNAAAPTMAASRSELADEAKSIEVHIEKLMNFIATEDGVLFSLAAKSIISAVR